MTALFELLPLYTLGALDRADAALVEQALAADPILRAELAEFSLAAAALGSALQPIAPDPAVRMRLLSAISDAPRSLTEKISELFDVAVDHARALLTWADQPTRWVTMSPGIEVAKVIAGPAQQTASCGLLRVAAGSQFPWHAHVGEEVALVLSGGARMAGGRQVGPGDEVIADPTIEHDFIADDDGPCVFAVRTAGMRFSPRPGD